MTPEDWDRVVMSATDLSPEQRKVAEGHAPRVQVPVKHPDWRLPALLVIVIVLILMALL